MGYNSRTMDELGRLVIPIDIRRTLNFEANDNFVFEVFGEAVMIKKVTIKNRCSLCFSEISDEDMVEVFQINNHAVCRNCINKIKE